MLIRLLQPHTHAGKPYFSGDVLDVTEPVALWLKECGVGEESAGISSQDNAVKGKKNPTHPIKNTHAIATTPELTSATGEQHDTKSE